MNIQSYKSRRVDPEHPVEIYRCLGRSGIVFSVRQLGLVRGHYYCTQGDQLLIEGASIHVNESGRDIVKKTGIRNVHAYIKGKISKRKPSMISGRLQYDIDSPSCFRVGSRQIEIDEKINVLFEKDGPRLVGIA